MGCLLQGRSLALIGTRVFKGTVSAAQRPWNFLYIRDFSVYIQKLAFCLRNIYKKNRNHLKKVTNHQRFHADELNNKSVAESLYC